MIQNLNEQTKTLLSAWWNNNHQCNPIILGTVYTCPVPQIDDINEYWRDNRARFEIFKTRSSSASYFGCAIPHHYVDFGSSAMAGVLGSPMHPMNHDTIWPSRIFHKLPTPDEINIDAAGSWYKNIYELTNLSALDTNICTAFYALGGINDTLGSLYGEQNLLMDMIDRPDDVHSCLSKICDIWIEEKKKLCSLISSHQEGMASWAGIWANGSTFPVQDDISFMLSKDFFDNFCLPYIKKCIENLDYPIYHLDGPGSIPHLDSILTIDKLRVIQWVPGAGNLELRPWYPLIEKILDSGRSVQLFCNVDEVGPLVSRFGAKGLLLTLFDATTNNIHKLERYF